MTDLPSFDDLPNEAAGKLPSFDELPNESRGFTGAVSDLWNKPPSGPSLIGMAKGIWEGIQAPGRAVSGEYSPQPQTPGMLTEEDVFRQRLAKEQEIKNAANLAGATPLASAPMRMIQGVKPIAPTIESLKSAAESLYKHPVVKNVEIKASAGPRLSQEIKGNLFDELGIDENLAPKTFGILGKLDKVPDQSFMTVQNLRSLRRVLGNAAKDIDGTERLAAKSSIDHLDEFLANLAAPDLIKGDAAQAASLLKEANGNYAAAMRASELDRQMVRAELRAAAANSGMNVGNTVRSRMADILLTPRLHRGFAQDELQQMEHLVRGGSLDNGMRMAGNVLGGGGGLLAAIYGLGHQALAPIAGYTLRKMSNLMTLRKADRIGEALRSRSPLAQQEAEYAARAQIPVKSASPTVAATAQRLLTRPRPMLSPFQHEIGVPTHAGEEQEQSPGPPGEKKYGGQVQQKNKIRPPNRRERVKAIVARYGHEPSP